MPSFRFSVWTSPGTELGVRLNPEHLKQVLSQHNDISRHDFELLDVWNLRFDNPSAIANRVRDISAEGRIDSKNKQLDQVESRWRQLLVDDWIISVNGVRNANPIRVYIDKCLMSRVTVCLHFEIFRPCFEQKPALQSLHIVETSLNASFLQAALGKRTCSCDTFSNSPRSEMITNATIEGQLKNNERKHDERKHVAMDSVNKLAYDAAINIVRDRGCLIVTQDYDGSSEQQGGYLNVYSGQYVRVLSDLHFGGHTDRFHHYVYVCVVLDSISEEESVGWVPLDILAVSLERCC